MNEAALLRLLYTACETSGLNNTWDWLQNSWTFLTIPQTGRFVQHNAIDLVNRTIANWLSCY